MSIKGIGRRLVRACAAVAGLILATAACNMQGHVGNIDSDGLARGVALQSVYAYLADGFAGLKIYNVSNPQSVNLTGQISLPGFVTRVEVEKTWAALNDTQNNCCYVVNVADKAAPMLAWAVKTQNRVVEIKFSGDVLYLAEKGTGSGFTGVEIFSYGADKPALKQTISLEDLVDIALDQSSFFALTSHGLFIYDRKGGIVGPLQGKLSLSGSDTLQSLDASLDHFPLLLGQSLYVVDTRNPAKPVLADQKALSGNPSPRMIRVSEPLNMAFTGPPWMHLFIPIVWEGGVFFYSTCMETGQGAVSLASGKILFLKQTYDLASLSEGNAKLYYIALARPLNWVLSQGGICALGALDNYGLVYAWLK
jgi:hypothetical protein